MIKSISTGAGRIRSWLSGASSVSLDEQTNVSRRMFLAGAAAVAVTVVVAGMPSEAEAQHGRRRSGRRHNRRRSGYYDRHDRYRSRRSQHNSYRSGSGWGGAPGCYIGPLFVSPCPF